MSKSLTNSTEFAVAFIRRWEEVKNLSVSAPDAHIEMMARFCEEHVVPRSQHDGAMRILKEMCEWADDHCKPYVLLREAARKFGVGQ